MAETKKKAPQANIDDPNYARCSSCLHAEKKRPKKGRLRCKAYEMVVNAMTDEIPDACAKFEPE